MQPDAIYITPKRGEHRENKQQQALRSYGDAEFKGRTFLLDTKAGGNKAEVIVWSAVQRGSVELGKLALTVSQLVRLTN